MYGYSETLSGYGGQDSEAWEQITAQHLGDSFTMSELAIPTHVAVSSLE